MQICTYIVWPKQAITLLENELGCFRDIDFPRVIIVEPAQDRIQKETNCIYKLY